MLLVNNAATEKREKRKLAAGETAWTWRLWGGLIVETRGNVLVGAAISQ